MNSGETVTFSAGGRGVDMDGNDIIGSNEGLLTAGRPFAAITNRDGLQQTVAEMMQLVRVIQVGMDVDGDGKPDLDAARLYFLGSSLGGNYGIPFQSLEPTIRAGSMSFAGAPRAEANRLSSAFRGVIGTLLQDRIPSLINAPGVTQIGGANIPAPYFNENKPLRNLPPLMNNVVGAMDIQRVMDYQIWINKLSDPGSWAPYLRKKSLAGMAPRPIHLLVAKGDMTVPVPTAMEIIRAGDLADVTTYFRFDLVRAKDSTITATNPHVINTGTNAANGPTISAIAVAMQEQVAAFFEVDGAKITQPVPAEFFEVPIKLPLPENIEFSTNATPIQAPVNSAIFDSALSPGSLFTIFGQTNAIMGEQSAGSGTLPTTLGGVMVSINGKPAPLTYVGRTQINGQVPFETVASGAIAQVIANGTSGAQVPFVISQIAPRLFSGQGNICIAQNEDGTLITANNPVKTGRYIGAYMLGIGAVTPAALSGEPTRSVPVASPVSPVSALLGGRKIVPTYVGMIPGYVGIAQVDLLIPLDMGAGLQGFSVTVGTAASNTCQIAVAK